MQNISENTWETYAKLLSENGVTLEYSNKAATAKYNGETKKITVPTMSYLDDDLTQLLVSHEVGHAIWTNFEDFDEELLKKHHDVFNVLEDVRIERLLLQKYKGLKKLFFNGYKKFYENNFFSTEGMDVSESGLIDRLNLFWKIGSFMDVPFLNPIEKGFVKEMLELQTIEEVITLAKKIIDYLGEEKDNTKTKTEKGETKEGNSSDGQSDGSEENEKSEKPSEEDRKDGEQSDDAETSDDGENEEGEGNGNGEREDNSESSETSNSTNGSEGSESNSLNSFEKKLEEAFKKAQEENEKNKNPYDYEREDVLSMKTEEYNRFFDFTTLYPAIKKNGMTASKAAVEKLIKTLAMEANREFQRKKTANENKNSRLKIVGKLDMKRIARYKTSSNIFTQLKTLPEGVNHGVVILMDCSGSMCEKNVMKNTVIQALITCEFCKLNNIPFELYAFGLVIFNKNERKYESLLEPVLLASDKNYDLRSVLILQKAKNFTIEDGENSFWIAYDSTPLVEAVAFATERLIAMKKRGVEKSILFCITDGARNHVHSHSRDYSKDRFHMEDYDCVERLVFDNTLMDIKTYLPNYKDYKGYRGQDWIMELLLKRIKIFTDTTVVFSFLTRYGDFTDFTPSGYRTVPPHLYSYKHARIFKEEIAGEFTDGLITYHTKKDPFVDSFLIINTDFIEESKKESKDIKDDLRYFEKSSKVMGTYKIFVKELISAIA